MYLIANNINTRDEKIGRIFRDAKRTGWSTSSEPAEKLKELAQQCAAAGAHALEINIQHHHDKPEAMEFAVNVVKQVTDLRLFLSTNNIDALLAGLRASKHQPVANYISLSEERLGETLPMIAKHGAGVVFLVSEPAAITDAREMLRKTAILSGAANEVGIPNDDIYVDPGIIHVTSDVGQRHMVEVMEYLHNLPEATEPQIKSTCWLTNSSPGAPLRFRSVIETTLLPMLAGAGLSSVFMNILRPENQRVIRLIKIFNNEVVYSDNELKV